MKGKVVVGPRTGSPTENFAVTAGPLSELIIDTITPGECLAPRFLVEGDESAAGSWLDRYKRKAEAKYVVRNGVGAV